MKIKSSLVACGIFLAALLNAFGQPAVWVRFSADTYSAYERDRTVTITVCGYGDITNPFTVEYTTSDGAATAGADYVPQSGTLSFAARESEKTFTIPIFEDGLGEGDETVKLTLSNPTGGVELYNHFVNTLHIVDDYKPGSLDFNFHPTVESTNRIGDQMGGWISSLIVQSDGKLLILGSFESVNGVLRQGLARLEVDGSLDESFPDLTATTPALQPDGKILLARSFIDDETHQESEEILRLNPNGTLDAKFNLVVTNQDGSFRYLGDMLPQKDGKILVRGIFSSVNGISPIARLNADGSLGTGFQPVFRSTNAVGEIPPAITSWALREDGRILVTGEFHSVDGETRHHIAQLNADGSLDKTFRPDPRLRDRVGASALQTDGKVLLGGFFDLGKGPESVIKHTPT